MAEWRQAEWRKSFRRGVTSESLIGIGANARALFWTLFTCAWWDEESPEGRLLESPDPHDAKSIEALGAMSDLTQGQARAALERLRRKHIAEVDDHGVVILPKFRKWQRGESTERTRKYRERNVPGTVPGTDITDSRQQTADSPVVPKGDPSPNPLVAHVLAEMASAVRELKPDLRGPRDTPANRKAIAKVTKAQSLTPDLWTQAIRAQLENVRPNPEHWGYLSLSTLCVPRNMARLIEAPLAKPGAMSAQGGLPSFDDYERASAEENARATR